MVASFNVANLTTSDARAEAVRLATDNLAEVVAVQECDGCDELVASLGPTFLLDSDPQSGVAIVYNAERFALVAGGTILLGENDDGWGNRVARWARLEDLGSAEELLVYSTHFCVPIRNINDRCTATRQIDYVERILEHRIGGFHADMPTIIAGDFNVFDGFSQSPAVTRLISDGYLETYAEAGVPPSPQTFAGNEWAPPGRIDFVFAGTSATVLSASVEAPSIGIALDHSMVVSTVSF